MERVSMAQKRVNRSETDIRSDFEAGASLKFLERKYEISAAVIRRNLAEWGLMSSEKDKSKIRNNDPFGWNKKAGASNE
jgi:Zn-dependent peptidase ImmA (M78 family)